MQDIQDDLVLDSDSQKINSQKLVFQSASMYYVDTLMKKASQKRKWHHKTDEPISM